MRLLDCNDASLRLWNDGDAFWSPGVVWLSGDRYQFGEPAWAQARRAPREISNRYWHRLSTQDLSPALGPARHTADLVHAHLEALLGDVGGELTLVIPGAMESPQLSLLLGILQTLPVNISAVTHRSALIGGATGQSCAHVELQLHQTCITSVSVERGVIALESLVVRDVSRSDPVVHGDDEARMLASDATRRLDVLGGCFGLPRADHEAQSVDVDAD